MEIEGPRGDTEKASKRGDWIKLLKLFFTCAASFGVQFVLAIETSVLAPYSQSLGIPHKFDSMIWMFGPVVGLLVQLVVGYYSDRCTVKLGRRRPFLIGECCVICLSLMLMGYAADLGIHLGHTKQKCSTYTSTQWAAVAVFVVGFLMLDCVVHMAQGTLRAMMIDLSCKRISYSSYPLPLPQYLAAMPCL
ncbi:sucrose transport protein SUT5 [Aegilops tauschii subsp. strangulata]|uniref:sucrose transport protein SUT5 n=1 Tax=Aegilops tauschii subsp. strangulata TaxID=200361 RepID=UPI001E1CA368|nr:sucrose transport protein SUT5 [Aegilops tauschii subsp. strangulata]XP_045086676.1 sucrose transport protein SUT5 [Aegilops tauschii subsp. strangulata]XP_045086677.1 sucrose transport protein SUT5 [Aegilops tauschii subsp. strangulata]XP_045086678.1 sucrose transport protein SUT5 [Aegilops tauschii subsp. strangulata]XP_045086679.1 sucrose transport protein SUT5 [Aegilops tauschii subsp. strangulata]